jgi:RNA polymerase sigma-70 factor, ECF subfamily
MFNLDLQPEEFDDLKSGGEEPFKKIFEQAYAPLCDYIKLLSNGTNDGKDIVQVAFIKFHKKKTGFGSEAKIMSWLRKTCRHGFLNWEKHNKVKQKHHQFLKNTAETTDPAQIDTAMAVKVAAELEKLLELEIENLPPKCKEIFKLAYLEELSTNEIAVRLNISVYNVSGQKDIAIQRLRKKLSFKKFLLMVLLVTLLGLKFFSEIFLNFDGLVVQYYEGPADQYTNNHKFYPNA